MTVKRVLVLDDQNESGERIAFFLRLRECLVTLTRDADEAVNWLAHRTASPYPFDLVLISTGTGEKELQRVLLELEHLSCQIPVFMIRRDSAGLDNSLCDVVFPFKVIESWEVLEQLHMMGTDCFQ